MTYVLAKEVSFDDAATLANFMGVSDYLIKEQTGFAKVVFDDEPGWDSGGAQLDITGTCLLFYAKDRGTMLRGLALSPLSVSSPGSASFVCGSYSANPLLRIKLVGRIGWSSIGDRDLELSGAALRQMAKRRQGLLTRGYFVLLAPSQFGNQSPPNFRNRTTYIATSRSIRLTWLARALNHGKNVSATERHREALFGENPEVENEL